MSYPTVYRAIDNMILEEALETPMTRAIARKAGLRSTEGTTRTRALTVLDVYVGIAEPDSEEAVLGEISYWWLVDFTGATEIRATWPDDATSVFVLYSDPSLEPSLDSLDPFDHPVLTGFDEVGDEQNVGGFNANSSGALGWLTLPPERRVPLRIAIRIEGELPYSFALQVR